MTRTIRTLALALLAFTTGALPAHADPANDPHIRTLEPEIREALEHGVRVSPTLQRLADTLAASDVVVYISFDRKPSPSLAGHLSFLAAVPGRRYLRVSIDRRLTGCQRLAILGHELQHAVEVAESRRVNGDTTLAELYQRIGFHSFGAQGECYESVSAILAGRMVEKEALRYTDFTVHRRSTDQR